MSTDDVGSSGPVGADVDRVLAVLRSLGSARARTVLGIDGPAGAGKTTLGRAVAERLAAPLVQMDDLYPGWDGLPASPALLATQVLAPWRRGDPASYRRYDWHQGAFAESVPVPAARVLVVEGCGSTVGIAGEATDCRIWVEAAPVERHRRGIARDGDMFAPHWQNWADAEDRMFTADGTRARAHLVLCTDEKVSTTPKVEG